MNTLLCLIWEKNNTIVFKNKLVIVFFYFYFLTKLVYNNIFNNNIGTYNLYNILYYDLIKFVLNLKMIVVRYR